MTGIFDPVADAGDGLDERGAAVFAAEPADGDLDGFGERVGVLVPGLGEEVFGAEGTGAAPSSASSTANSLAVMPTWRPSRVTVRRSGSSSIPAARRMRGWAAGLRRARARMRSTSSGK